MSWYLHLTTIHVTYHPHQVPEICISAPSRSYLKAIQVSRCVSHIHSGPVSDLSKLQNSCFISIQVPPSLHPSPYIHISPPSRYLRFTFNHLLWCAVHLNTFPIPPPSRSPQTHTGLKMWMSNASKSFLTYIQDPRFLSHLHPGTVSPPSRYQDSTKAPIYMPHLHLGRVSPPSRAHLTSIQISRIASQPHLTPSRSENVHSISIQVWSYTHPCLKNLCLTSLQAPRYMSPIHQLHASP